MLVYRMPAVGKLSVGDSVRRQYGKPS